MPKDERLEQGKEEWYEHWGKYNGRDYDDECYHKRHGYYEDSKRFNSKLDIPNFEGRIQPDDFLDWLNTFERVFKYWDPPKHKKMKFVTIKLHKNAYFKWENFKKQP